MPLKPVLVILCLCIAACTPAHNIKPLPNFVEAGLEPGDRVVVTTLDGDTSDFVVTDIRDATIFGEDYEIPLSDIARIQKRAWSRPESPCGGDKALGCSVPLLIRLTSEGHNHYRDKFYDACAQHDYCYRHGYRSYGVDRETCDERFLQNMHAICPAPAVNVVTKTIELLDDSVTSRRICLSVASDFHDAVRRYGAEAFQTDDSTYCEYDGPPHNTPK